MELINIMNQELVTQLDTLLAEYEALLKRSKYRDLSDNPEESTKLAYRLQAVFDRMTLPGDTYGKAADSLRSKPTHLKVVELCCLAYALRDDIQAGWVNRISELVRAETSADMIEMATDLLQSGYKDAAAVIVGTAAELHLRALANKHNISVIDKNGKPKKADAIRIELRQAQVSSALQDKRISY